ncbi:MAG: hypothetical protein ABI220_02610 [Candidatus Saccharimonadales bacterium]
MIEIDGIRRQLEQPNWESGDRISDEWMRLIDLTTDPELHSTIVLYGLASAVRRLNRNLGTTSLLLKGTKLAQVYNDVVEQVNAINSDRLVGKVEYLSTGASWSEASGLFIFAD